MNDTIVVIDPIERVAHHAAVAAEKRVEATQKAAVACQKAADAATTLVAAIERQARMETRTKTLPPHVQQLTDVVRHAVPGTTRHPLVRVGETIDWPSQPPRPDVTHKAEAEAQPDSSFPTGCSAIVKTITARSHGSAPPSVNRRDDADARRQAAGIIGAS